MVPVAWVKGYQVPGGAAGKVFMTTMGTSSNLTNNSVRRLLVNAALWCTGLDIPAAGANADLVGTYAPTKFEFRSTGYWKDRALTPAACRMK